MLRDGIRLVVVASACAAMLTASSLTGCAATARTTAGGAVAGAAPAAMGPEQAAVAVAQPSPHRTREADRRKDHFPNIVLYTQDGEAVRFYDDLVRDRVVLIYFMFTSCQGIGPATTTNVARMQDLLGDRFGRDIFFIAVTLTPDVDTPEVLKAYAEQYGAKPGWTFVTGDKDEIEMLRRKLGVYDPDPVVDADLYSHAGLVTFGNESTGRWSALPGTMDAQEIVRTMLRRTRPVRKRQ